MTHWNGVRVHDTSTVSAIAPIDTTASEIDSTAPSQFHSGSTE